MNLKAGQPGKVKTNPMNFAESSGISDLDFAPIAGPMDFGPVKALPAVRNIP